METEEEFYRAFEYKPEYRYDVELMDIYDKKPFVVKNSSKNEIISWHNDSQYLTLQVIKVIRIYPPITAEIVLKLIEIILSQDFYLDTLIAGYVFVNPESGVTIGGIDLLDAVKRACIQLKDEIKPEVQQLFKKG